MDFDEYLNHIKHTYYGLSAGLTEPIRAGLQSNLPYGQRFEQELENIRKERKEYRKRNPMLSSFLETSGTMASYVPLSILSGPIGGGLYGGIKGYNERGNVNDIPLSALAGSGLTIVLPRMVPK